MSKKFLNNVNRISRLLQPIKIIPKDTLVKPDATSKSYKLMLDMGIIRQANTGMYTLMPLGFRVLQKLIDIVDNAMNNIGAQKLLLPNLTSTSLWKRTNRLEDAQSEIFMVQDRHKNSFILSPTYEEAITDLVAGLGTLSPKKLPLMLYQISSKWRDEMKPRLGLFRGREFIMKDLYTFDANLENAENTYESVREAYENIFRHIGIEYTIAVGDTGMMGGTLSHEYHYLSDIGEDTVLSCRSCGFYINSNMYQENSCAKCNSTLLQHKAVEIAHTFLLGTRYSKPLQAMFSDQGKPKPLMMGCYGLGLTRLIATAVETLSKDEELRWPKHLAPYTVCIIPPKENSRYDSAMHYTETIYEILKDIDVDAIIDDRVEMTIGRRIIDARKTGYPYLVIIGKNSIETTPLFEIWDVNSLRQIELTLEQLKDFFAKYENTPEIERKAIIA